MLSVHYVSRRSEQRPTRCDSVSSLKALKDARCPCAAWLSTADDSHLKRAVCVDDSYSRRGREAATMHTL